MVGQLAALLVPGAGHSEDAEVVQDSSSTAAAMTLGHEGGGTGHGMQPSGLEILGCWAGHTLEVQCQLDGARWNMARVTSGHSIH